MNLTNGQIAQVAAAANKGYCESIGDFSQPDWANLPAEKKQLLIDGVEFIQKNPKATPVDSHNSWMKAMLALGWKYQERQKLDEKGKPMFEVDEDGGLVLDKDENPVPVMEPKPKNEVHKIHPCLVPYEDLPEEQKEKDALFIAVVRFFSPDPVVEEPKPKKAPAKEKKEPTVHDKQKELRK